MRWVQSGGGVGTILSMMIVSAPVGFPRRLWIEYSLTDERNLGGLIDFVVQFSDIKCIYSNGPFLKLSSG